MTGIVPEDGAVCVETGRRDFINDDDNIYIYIFNSMRVFIWYIKDITAIGRNNFPFKYEFAVFNRTLNKIRLLI